ncbi:hypothetical protein [Moorena producens]|uniref:hypothetical protein n=1 Tax=Moorena producens TaxID=1155739 RepID=UPI003C71ACBE
MFFLLPNLQASTYKPWPLATLREQPTNLGLWPRYANKLQPPNLGLWPRYANNIHPSTVSFSTNYHIPNP